MADPKPLACGFDAPPGKHYMIIAKNTDGRPCGWGKAKNYHDAKRVADEQWCKHGDGDGCYPGEAKGNYDVALVDEAPVSSAPYREMTEQAVAIVTFVRECGAEFVFGDASDDRDLLERAADHVATLNGYITATLPTFSTVSDTILRLLKKRLDVKEPTSVSLTE